MKPISKLISVEDLQCKLRKQLCNGTRIIYMQLDLELIRLDFAISDQINGDIT
jgi:hypothetical protein